MNNLMVYEVIQKNLISQSFRRIYLPFRWFFRVKEIRHSQKYLSRPQKCYVYLSMIVERVQSNSFNIIFYN